MCYTNIRKLKEIGEDGISGWKVCLQRPDGSIESLFTYEKFEVDKKTLARHVSETMIREKYNDYSMSRHMEQGFEWYPFISFFKTLKKAKEYRKVCVNDDTGTIWDKGNIVWDADGRMIIAKFKVYGTEFYAFDVYSESRCFGATEVKLIEKVV